jgi:hypothetical protein
MTREENNPSGAPSAPAPSEAPQNPQDFERTEIEARSTGWESEDLTPEELAYFNSRGEDTSKLGLPPEATPAPAPQPAPFTPPAPPPPAPAPVQATEAPRAPVTPDSAPIVPQPAPVAPSTESVGADEDVDLDKLTVDAQGVMRDERGRYVPHSALHKARERFKAERDRANNHAQENAALQQKLATLEGRFATLSELVKPQAAQPAAPAAPAEPEDVAPNPETDIFGYVAWQSRQIDKANKRIEALQAKATQDVEAVRGQVTEANMMQHYKSDAQAFAATKPEFAPAYRHLINGRNLELSLLGYEDATERMRIINNEERELVTTALRLNKRPAEFMYNIAVSRGFNVPAAPPPPPPPPTPAPVVAAPPVTAPVPVPVPHTATPAAINGAQHLANLAAAQAASATLSGAGGASGDGVTMEMVAAMSDAEFEAFQQRVGGKKGLRQFLGG